MVEGPDDVMLVRDQFTNVSRMAGARPRSMPRPGRRENVLETAVTLGRSDVAEIEALDRNLDGLDDLLDGATFLVVRETRPQDRMPRRRPPGRPLRRPSRRTAAEGADDLLEIDAGCVPEEAVEEHAFLRRRQLVGVDDTDLARLRHSVTPRSGKDRLEEVARTLLAIASLTGQHRP